MNRKWSPNWLIFFTIALFVTTVTMFGVTIKDQFGLKKCVYGDNEYTIGESIPSEANCYCDQKGNVICQEIERKESIEAGEYTNENLEFSSEFLNFVDTDSTFESIRFGEISTTDSGLKIVVERLSMCNMEKELPPQIGFYKVEDSQLYVTTTTNLLADDYAKECMVSNTFEVNNISEIGKIAYQSEDSRIIEANICVFNEKVFNKGDAFVGEDGEVVVCD